MKSATKMVFKVPFGGPYVCDTYPIGESLTHQSMKDECDINKIMSRWQKTGVLEHVSKYEGRYGDFLSVTDYQSSLNAIMEAQEAFASLPSTIRDHFSNDPSNFLSAFDDPERREELISLGLIEVPIHSDQGTEIVSNTPVSEG